MSYSRHQLYALGEPLGESVTRVVGGKIIYGGGGGGAPTSSTVTQSNIPDWLRPQVETTLGAGMQEIFNYPRDAQGKMIPNAEGKFEPQGLKPFVPYSQNPADYVAGFSPMQEQAFGNVANLQVPGQYGTGTQMAQMAGQGALSVAPQAAGIAAQQANAGNQYMGMATDPSSMGAFMSPYMQNVVNVQQQQAQRQADIANQAAKAGFAQRGAFGGGAQGIAQAQANADLMRTKQGIQATGLQNAFQNAQQAQQFGANLGLQGMQGAQQGMQNVLGAYDLLGRQGANVGNLGTQQLAAQKDIIGLQSSMGGQQQQQQQNIINQAIQNFANARQYPMQQLNAYNALLRGYAMPGQTATSYQAGPAPLSQLAGLGMGAYGLSQMMTPTRSAEGGIIRGMARGGSVQSMATGGLPELNRKVLFDPDSVTLDQVQQGVKNETISDLIGIPVALQKQKASQQAAAMQQQPPSQTIAEQALGPTIMDMRSNLPEQMAHGGIVAFNGEQTSVVKAPVAAERPSLATTLAQFREALGADKTPSPEMDAFVRASQDAARDTRTAEQQQGARWLQAGLGALAGKSPFALQNIAEGAQPALAGYTEDIAKRKAAELAALKMQADLAEARRGERRQEVTAAADLFGKQLEIQGRRETAKERTMPLVYAENYLAMKRAEGDFRPDSEVLKEGVDEYLYRYGAAGARAQVAAAGVASTAGTAAADLEARERRAREAADVELGRQRAAAEARAYQAWDALKMLSPEKREYRRLLEDRSGGKTPEQARAEAEAYKKAEIDKRVGEIPANVTVPTRTPPGAAAPRGAAPAPTSYPKPTPAAIEFLQNNPKLAAKFNDKYGPGSAEAILKPLR